MICSHGRVQSKVCAVLGTKSSPRMSVGRLWAAVRVRCTDKATPTRHRPELCGVSDDWWKASGLVHWLFGGYMVGLLVVLIVPLLFSLLVMTGRCRFFRVTQGMSMHSGSSTITCGVGYCGTR